MTNEEPKEPDALDAVDEADAPDALRGLDFAATLERPSVSPLRAAWDDESGKPATSTPSVPKVTAGLVKASKTETSPQTFDFDGFYLTHRGRLLAAMTRFCNGDRSLAEDVVQQTFLAAYRRRDQLPEIENPYGWLSTVAKRAAMEIFRKENLVKQRSLEHQDLRPPMPAFEESVDLYDLLLRLPERERQVIEYRYVFGYPRNQIAERLGLSVRTVDYVISKALKKLTPFLNPPKEDAS